MKRLVQIGKPVSCERVGGQRLSDQAFVEKCYQSFLERPSDPQGKKAAVSALKKGLTRFDFIKGMVAGPEYYGLLTRNLFGEIDLPDLRRLRPEKYTLARKRYGEDFATVLNIESESDYDWIENMITECGYYENMGVWSIAIDEVKFIFGEIINKFGPSRCLEIGCSTGALLKILHEQGVYCEGIEISHKALALSYPEIRRRIHFGDLLSLDLSPEFDMIIGLDVFEHLNPRKLDSYLGACYRLLGDGGFLLANIPAFGRDPIFGEIFPVYLACWDENSDMPFPALDADKKGWPLNGHLTWGTTRFWQKSFEIWGFKREMDVESAIHSRYDNYFSVNAEARQAIFVFSKNVKEEDSCKIASSIQESDKKVSQEKIG